MKNSNLKTKGRSYQELLVAFHPKVIKSKSGLDATVEVVESLMNKEELTTDEKDYKELLIMLIDDYEEKKFSISDIYGVELLKGLMKERGLRQKDLVHIFKTKSVVSEILSGQRELTPQYTRRLAEYFNIPDSAFYPLQTHDI
ncbi:type II toxin-antitoxin system HigA family antitoxin [Synechococcus sp. PCC 7335]|uniref:helix-turn-helix domain-containing protein n=1 Tax=Synechococcus sp. (strain ATCC 29403 / PCC 7335) TaxID=91464 RepID=UPI0003189E81|nr:transcriptional regulator [Synechococcus sp. PCC 7335]